MKTSTMLKSAVAAGAFAVAGVATANADTITVQAGDTLSKLARANGTTVDALAKANGISNPNLIFVGQQLQTEGTANASAPAQPAATQPAVSAPAASANGTYTVKAGDTLNHIAAANGTSVAALAAANGIQNINLIAVGQVLKLSADATAPAATPAPAQPAASAQTQPAAPAQPAASGSVPDDVKYIAAADTNRDGFMTAAEYLAYQANGGTTAPAAPQVTQVSTAGNSAAATMLNSLNALRASLGLRPVTLDAGLSAQAQSRAYNAVANGGLPTNHFRTNGEVVAIGFGFNQVISAWYNETGMTTVNGLPGHRMWVTNPSATAVGFGVVGGTIVAVSNVGQF